MMGFVSPGVNPLPIDDRPKTDIGRVDPRSEVMQLMVVVRSSPGKSIRKYSEINFVFLKMSYFPDITLQNIYSRIIATILNYKLILYVLLETGLESKIFLR